MSAANPTRAAIPVARPNRSGFSSRNADSSTSTGRTIVTAVISPRMRSSQIWLGWSGVIALAPGEPSFSTLCRPLFRRACGDIPCETGKEAVTESRIWRVRALMPSSSFKRVVLAGAGLALAVLLAVAVYRYLTPEPPPPAANFDPSAFVRRGSALDAPYVTTDYAVVDAMLAMAEVRPG